MADDNFRSYRGRDGGIPAGAQDDPLAELARLIGQSDPAGHGRNTDPAPDWPAQDADGARFEEDRYAAPAGTADYDAAYDDRYEASPETEFQSYRPGQSDDQGGAGGRPSSALSTRLNGAREFARDYYVPPEQSQFREVAETRAVADRQPPALRPQAPVERYQFDDDAADDQAYDEYQEEERPAGRRRSGFFVVAAVLGLAVIGTAGAFAYRAMFGSSMLPTLPPIIKADDGPNKIIPTKPKSSSDQADASDHGSGEKLVSREEQPVDMPAPVNPTPRAVSTIPIFPDPNSGQAGVPNAVQSGMAANPMAGAPAAPAPTPPPVAASAPPVQANSIWPPAPASAVAAAPLAAGPVPTTAAASNAPRKVHTVIIHSDQLDPQGGAMTADSAPPSAPTAAPEPAPVRAAPVRAAAPAPARPMPAARIDANAPLSIVPGQNEEAPPAPRLRTAAARPAEALAAPRPEAAGVAGGYAVQVTSQRSEAAAQAEFRALKAKFPSQLTGREPLIRRADLGAKGVYYRAMVGPFASAEQATALCSGLKSAGGSCIVQRN